jgi:hypothetical protein
MILDVTLEFFAAHALDDVAGQRESVIGIRRNLTWRENATWHFIHEIRAQRFKVALSRNEKIFQCFLKSARVSKQLPKCNRFRISSWDWKIEVIADVAIQVELALFDQLHHGCGSE